MILEDRNLANCLKKSKIKLIISRLRQKMPGCWKCKILSRSISSEGMEYGEKTADYSPRSCSLINKFDTKPKSLQASFGSALIGTSDINNSYLVSPFEWLEHRRGAKKGCQGIVKNDKEISQQVYIVQNCRFPESEMAEKASNAMVYS